MSYYVVSMKLTFSVDETVVHRARKAAESLGVSLNQAVRAFLEELAGGVTAETDINELEALSAGTVGRSNGWNFDRDETHRR